MHVADHHAHRTDCLVALAEAGADLSAKEQRGRSVLHFAAWCNQLPVARLLLDAGLSADVTDDYDETPLHFAAHMGNVSMIRLLLCRGANINAVNRDHETPLHIAVAAWHEPAVRLLLEWGAATTLRDGTFKLTAQEAAANQKLLWAEELFASRGPVPTLQMLCRLSLCKNNSRLYGCRNAQRKTESGTTTKTPVFTEVVGGEKRTEKVNGRDVLHSSESDSISTNKNGATNVNEWSDAPSGPAEGRDGDVGAHQPDGVFNFNSDDVATNQVPAIIPSANTVQVVSTHTNETPAVNGLTNQLRPLSISTNGTIAKADTVSTNEITGSRVWNVDGSVDYRVPRRLDVYLGMSEELQSAMVG